ncbi:hypothetical protein [Streptomyces sp. NPDC001435]|uniref:hypothetical protein n=1 Tax=unclassified Streptomyces TaxID=2593676 RepID=UPI0036A77433
MEEKANTSTAAVEFRPLLTADLTGAELLRWYWTLDELTGLARTMGVARHGGKAALTAGSPRPWTTCRCRPPRPAVTRRPRSWPSPSTATP